MIDPTGVWAPALVNPLINDNRLAAGLVRIDTTEIRFEGDTHADGIVRSITYKVNGSGTCTLCLQRSEVPKVTGNPADATVQIPSWGTSVNDVVVSSPIFTYFQANGTQIPAASLPIDITTGASTIASIKTIQISLTVRNNAVVDQQTGLPIEATFEGLITLNNCSMAASGAPMSCN
jgi:hypothetical protein